MISPNPASIPPVICSPRKSAPQSIPKAGMMYVTVWVRTVPIRSRVRKKSTNANAVEKTASAARAPVLPAEGADSGSSSSAGTASHARAPRTCPSASTPGDPPARVRLA